MLNITNLLRPWNTQPVTGNTGIPSIQTLQNDVLIGASGTIISHDRTLPPAGYRIEIEWSLGWKAEDVGGSLETTLFLEVSGDPSFTYGIANGGAFGTLDVDDAGILTMRVIFDVPEAVAGADATFTLSGVFSNPGDGNARVFGATSVQGSGNATMKVTYYPPDGLPGTVGSAVLIP